MVFIEQGSEMMPELQKYFEEGGYNLVNMVPIVLSEITLCIKMHFYKSNKMLQVFPAKYFVYKRLRLQSKRTHDYEIADKNNINFR